MKKKEFLYIGGIVLLILALFVVRSGNEPINWAKSYSGYDKNPYGSYSLGELIGDLFPGQNVQKSNNTLYQIAHQENFDANFIVIAQSFMPDDESFNTLIDQVSSGGNAFISAQSISKSLLDTLELTMGYEETTISQYFETQDSISISLIGGKTFQYKAIEFGEYLDDYPDRVEVLGTNENQHPIAIKLPFGKGNFILSTTPIVFTNYFMLFDDNYLAAASLLSQLPVTDVHWTDYYQIGHLNSDSPFRALLKYDSLKLSLYVTLGLLVLYLLFQSKRKQRIIPIIEQLPNHTLQFIRTIGTLYYHSGDRKAMIMNRVSYFKEYLSIVLGIRWTKNKALVELISAKSGVDHALAEQLFNEIRTMEANNTPSNDDILILNKTLEKFYNRRTQTLSNK